MVIYGAIGMRSTMLQAMPYMTLLSVFVNCTCANPMLVQSPNLKERMTATWCNKPWEIARNIVETRNKLEADLRDDEIHEETHSLPNPEIDSSGVNVPVPVRNLIAKHNEMWRSHIKSLEGKPDVVNEWEVALKGLHMSVANSNACGFIIGLCKYMLVIGLLFSSSEHHNLLVLISFLAFFPYCLIMVLPSIVRVGISMYISDADIKNALGWMLLPLNIFGYKFTWLSEAPVPSELSHRSSKFEPGPANGFDEYNGDSTSPMHNYTSEMEMVCVNSLKINHKKDHHHHNNNINVKNIANKTKSLNEVVDTIPHGVATSIEEECDIEKHIHDIIPNN